MEKKEEKLIVDEWRMRNEEITIKIALQKTCKNNCYFVKYK